jgi:hypothetical protein
MKTQANDAAFARPGFYHEYRGVMNYDDYGLTKREYFAAKAMQGFLAVAEKGDSPQIIATASVVIADALIAALNREIDYK